VILANQRLTLSACTSLRVFLSNHSSLMIIQLFISMIPILEIHSHGLLLTLHSIYPKNETNFQRPALY